MTGLESTLRTCRIADDNTIIIGFIVLFLLFTYALYRCRTILAYKMKTYFSSRQMYIAGDIMSSEREQIALFLLIFIGMINISLVLFADANETISGKSINYPLFFNTFLTVSLCTVMQICTYIFINWVFFLPETSRRWISSYMYLLATVSIAAIPLSILRIFNAGNISAFISYCLITVVIMQKIIVFCKLFVNFRPKRYGRLLFFLYFCGVEIMPALIVLHIFRQMRVLI